MSPVLKVFQENGFHCCKFSLNFHFKVISSERVGSEMKKILANKFSDKFIKLFYELNISKYIGLPPKGNIGNYAQVYKNIFELKPQPMTLLFSLILKEEDVSKSLQVQNKLKEKRQLEEVLVEIGEIVNRAS